MNLESLGADHQICASFLTYATQGLELGRVAVSHRDRYRLYTASGMCEAEPSGGLWHRTADPAEMPVVGDWVAARRISFDEAIVEAVLPRRTLFARRAAGRREDRQALAANIDIVFLVCGLDGDFAPRRIERYLTLTAESGAAPVIVLNKCDLTVTLAEQLAETDRVARATPVVVTSGSTGAGVDALARYLGAGVTVALLGSSGAGKSTLVNRLLGEDRFRAGPVRAHDSRGRHTTTHRELVPLPEGGALIDTPGLRELQLWASEESVHSTFDEIAALAPGCRYRDCSHSSEPGCAVSDAMAAGTLAPERWSSYRKLLGEARRHEEMAEPLAAQERKRQVKQIQRERNRILKETRTRR